MEPTASPATPVPAAALSQRGGCFGCALSGSLGCGAFLAGALLAIALFAPQLLGGWAARLVEATLREHVDGTLTVGGTELAWADDVRLRDVVLQDADGAVVARGSVRLPSLTDALDEFDEAPAVVRVRAQELALRVDGSGRWNLARVLRFAELQPAATLFRRAQAVGSGGPGFHIAIEAGAASLSDERTGFSATLTDLGLELGRTARERPLTLSLTCRVPRADGAAPGELALRLRVAAPEGGAPSELHLELTARALPTEVLALCFEACSGEPAPWRSDELVALLGPVVEVGLALGDDARQGAALRLDVRSERGTARLTGQLAAGRLTLDGGPVGTWRVPEAIALAALARFTPPGLALTAEAGPSGTAERTVELTVQLDSAAVDTALDRAFWPELRLAALELDARCGVRGAVGEGAAAYAVAEPVALVRYTQAAGGTVALHWRPGTGLARAVLRLPPLGAGSPARLDLDLPALPTALLVAHAGLPEEGAALLGERIRLVLEGLSAEAPASGGARFALHAGVGSQPVLGEVSAGVARAADAAPQTLWLPSDPATLAGLLGPLLPWLDQCRAPHGGAVEVTFDDVTVPLDGGRLRPRGRLTLGLPELAIAPLPAFARLFGAPGDGAPNVWRPARFAVELNDEVVRYPAVEVPIGEDALRLSGTFDRVTRSIDLEGEVPARLVQDSGLAGTEVGALLAESDWPVFVHVSGTVQAPRLLIDRAQWGRLLERAVPTLRGALEQLAPRDR